MTAIFTPTVRCIACDLATLLVAFAQAGGANYTADVRVTEESPKASPAGKLKLTGVQNGDHHWALVRYAQPADAGENTK